jgi:hypothetical protein
MVSKKHKYILEHSCKHESNFVAILITAKQKAILYQFLSQLQNRKQFYSDSIFQSKISALFGKKEKIIFNFNHKYANL